MLYDALSDTHLTVFTNRVTEIEMTLDNKFVLLNRHNFLTITVNHLRIAGTIG